MAGAPPADGAEVSEQALIHRLAGDAAIRDKVAASKARGMWMGGKVPLGYEVANRKLVVNEAEAKSVRQVFECFAETGSVTTLATLRRVHAAQAHPPLAAGERVTIHGAAVGKALLRGLHGARRLPPLRI